MAESDLERPDQLTALVAGAAALARGSDLDEAIGVLVGAVVAAVGAVSASISLQDPDRPEPELALTIGIDPADQPAVESAAASPSHPLTVAARDRVLVRAGTTAAFPLIVSRGGIEEAVGSIAFDWPDADSQARGAVADGQVLAATADLVALAVDRARLASTIAERSEWFERLAHTDPLTGLANLRTVTRVLELELARAGRQGSEVSVAMFDIDDFAATNESAGREVGDDVLRSVASVLAGAVRLVDTVARSGGDEFVLVAPGSAGLTVAQRVLEGVASLPEIGGRRISVSAGVARFPVDGSDAETILAAAKSAIARARTEGLGSVEASQA